MAPTARPPVTNSISRRPIEQHAAPGEHSGGTTRSPKHSSSSGEPNGAVSQDGSCWSRRGVTAACPRAAAIPWPASGRETSAAAAVVPAAAAAAPSMWALSDAVTCAALRAALGACGGGCRCGVRRTPQQRHACNHVQERNGINM
eukprot:360309-Chlamydomonas_euryale.AAC.6